MMKQASRSHEVRPRVEDKFLEKQTKVSEALDAVCKPYFTQGKLYM